MRRIDLHCYPGTQEWVDSQGPFAEALAEYWNKPWVGRPEDDVVDEVRGQGLEAVLVAFDIESLTGAKPFSNEAVGAMRDRHPDVFIGAWGAVDPLKGEDAILEAERAAREDRVLGFHFHPIMGHFRVDDPRYHPLFEVIRTSACPSWSTSGRQAWGLDCLARSARGSMTHIPWRSTTSRRRSLSSRSLPLIRDGPGSRR